VSKQKILYIVHNHPVVRPGGAEAYALEVYEGLRSSEQFEPIFLARTGPPVSSISRYREGTLFTSVNDDPNQYFIYTDAALFDWFYGTSRDKDLYTKYLHEFLLAHKPDIVHFQHTLFLGYDLIRQVKNTLPDVPIVYTLHEYLPICHRQGQMVRVVDNKPCLEASPRRCHECFPDISPQDFFMRAQFVKSHFSLVDLFIAPSKFLMERYLAWGIPPEKIRFEEYGRLAVAPLADTAGSRERNRFGFFGQLSYYKGVNVALKAMQLLEEENLKAEALSSDSTARGANLSTSAQLGSICDAHLLVHGANLELQPEAFREEFAALIKATAANTTLIGRYEHRALPKLMANLDWVIVPSLWWENSPLVIQEAFAYGKPIICSDIGGMAEKVSDGVNGLHFRADDPISLADTIRRAVSTPGLWEKLRAGIPEVYAMDRHIEELGAIYQGLLQQRLVER
jgi:glycosyltransferase involved in cell wall biosynthesis